MLLPSEKARLVLGYLIEEGPQEAYEHFLAHSKHLREFRSLIRNNENPNVHHPTFRKLSDVLDEYYQINSLVNSIDVRAECFSKVADCKSLRQKIEIILTVAKRNNSENSKSLKDISPDPFLKSSNHRKADRISEKVDKDCIKSNIVPDLAATELKLPVQKRFLNSTAYDDLPDESVFSDNSTATFSIGNYSPPEKKLYSAKYNSRTVRKKKFIRPPQPQNLHNQWNKEDEVLQISSDENDANIEMEKKNEESTYNVLRNTLLEHPDMHTQIAETINKTILNKNKMQHNLEHTDKAILTDNSNSIKISDKNNLTSEGTKAIDQAQIDLILAELEKIPEYDKVVDDIFGSQDQSGSNLRNAFVAADNNTETSENSPNRQRESKCSSDESQMSAPLRDRLRSRQRNISTLQGVKRNVKSKAIKLPCNKRNSIGVTTSKPKTSCVKNNNLQDNLPNNLQKKLSAKNLFEQNTSCHTSSKTNPDPTLITFNDVNDSTKKIVESTSINGKEQKDKIIILSDELIKGPLPKYIPSSNPTPASECIIGPCASVSSDSNMIISYSFISAPQQGVSAYGTEQSNPEPGGDTDITNMPMYVLQSSQVTGYMPLTDERVRPTANQTKYKRILPKPPQPTVTALSRIDTIHGNVIINSLPQISNPPVQVSSAFVPISNINFQYSAGDATKEKIENSTIDVSNTNINEIKNNNTPTVTMSSNSRSQSMSTPRRTSHIRALDFNSPSKLVLCPKANSSSKTDNAKRNLNTANNSNAVVSLNNKSVASNNLLLPLNNIQENESNSTLNRLNQFSEPLKGLNQITIPIATRSPIPALKGEWGRVNGLGVIFGETESPIKKVDSSQDNHINFDSTCGITVIENQKAESNISATPVVQLRTSAEEKDSNTFNISTCDENTDSKKKSQVIKKAKSENKSSLTTNIVDPVKSPNKNFTADEKNELWHKQRNVSIVKKSWDSDLRRNVANPTETVKNVRRTRRCKNKIGGKKAAGRKTLKKAAVSKAADSTQLNSSLDDTMEQGQQIEEALNSSNNENISPERNRTTISADLSLSHNDETSDPTNQNVIIYDIRKTNPKYSIVDSRIIIADDDTTAEDDLTAESNLIKTTKEPKTSPSSSRKVLIEKKTKTVSLATKKLQKSSSKNNCDKFAEKNSGKETIMGDEEGENSKKLTLAADDKSKDNFKKLINEQLDNESSKTVIQIIDAEKNIAIDSNHDVAVNDSNIESEKSSPTEISIKADVKQSEISPEIKSALSDKFPINKNVSFTLDTPYKYDPKSFPATPRFVMTDQTQETPLTKLIKTHADQTSLMKCGIPTPDFAVTPKIVVTPKHFEAQSDNKSPSGYANRATDYSSCSSYYKPDESEDINIRMDSIFNADNKNTETKNDVIVSKDLPKEKLLTTTDSNAAENSAEVNDKTLSFNESSPTKSVSSDSDTDTSDSSSCSNSSADDSTSSDSCTSDSSYSKSSPNSKSRESNENNSSPDNEKKVFLREENSAKRPRKKDKLKSQATTIISTKIDIKEQENCENKKVEQTTVKEAQNQNLFSDNKNNEISNDEEKERHSINLHNELESAQVPYTTRNTEKDKCSDINEQFQSKKTIKTNKVTKQTTTDITNNVQSTLLKNDNLIQPEEVEKGLEVGTGTAQNYMESKLLQGTEDVIVDGKLSDILEAKRTRTINKLKSMNTTSKGQRKTTKKEPLKTTAINKINPGKTSTEGKLADKIRGISREIEESEQAAEVREGSKTKALKSNVQGSNNLQQGSNRRKSLTPRKAVKRILLSPNSSSEISNDIAKNVNVHLQDADGLQSEPLVNTEKEESVSQSTNIANKLSFGDSRGSDGYPSLHLSSEEDVVESDIDLNTSASMKQQLIVKSSNKFQEHLINTGFNVEHANKIETVLNKSPLEDGEIDEEDSNDTSFTNKINLISENNTTGKFTAESETLDPIKKNNNLKKSLNNKNNSDMNSNEEAIFNFKETNVTNTSFLNFTVSTQTVKGDGSAGGSKFVVNEKQNEDLDQSKTKLASNDSQDSSSEDDDVDFSIRDTFAEVIVNINESESFVKNSLSSEDDGFNLNLYKVNAPTEDGEIRVITATQLITLMDIEPELKIETIRKDIKIHKKTPLNKLLDELNDKEEESTPANNRKATIVTSTPLANLYELSPKNKSYKHPTHEGKNGAHFKYAKVEKHTDNVEKADSDDAETNKIGTDGMKEQIKTSYLKSATNVKGKIQRRTSIDRRAKNVTKKDSIKPELIKNSEETSVTVNSAGARNVNNGENITTNETSRVDVSSPQAAKRPRGRPRIKPLPNIPPKSTSKAAVSSDTKETTTDVPRVVLNESDMLPNKRKANDDAFNSLTNKKVKTNTQEFLKKTGFDSILDMLHGPAKKEAW